MTSFYGWENSLNEVDYRNNRNYFPNMKTRKILLRRNPLYEKCPSCSTPNSIRRSRSRNPLEIIIKHTTFFKTYRCSKCGWRGYLSTFSVTADSVKSLVFYLVLALIAGYIVLQLLRRFA